MTHAFKKVTALLLGLTMLGGTFGGAFLAFNDGGTPTRAVDGYDWDFTKGFSKNSSSYDTKWIQNDLVVVQANNNNGREWDYVRVGGKTTTTRTMVSLTASPVAIESVNLLAENITSHTDRGTMSAVTLEVATAVTGSETNTDLDESTIIDTVSGVTVSTDMLFEPTSGTSWSAGSYFRLSFSWTATKSSNAGMDVQKVLFNSSVPATTLESLTVTPTEEVYYTTDVLSAETYTVSGTKSDGTQITDSDYTVAIGTKTGTDFTKRADVIWGETHPVVEDNNIRFTSKIANAAGEYPFADVEISVEAPELTNLTISGDMNRKSYNTGDLWDNTGLTVTGMLGSDQIDVTKDVSWTYDPSAPTIGIDYVNVTAKYGEAVVSKTINGIQVFNYVKDTITIENTPVTSSSYTGFENVQGNTAVYAGNIARNNENSSGEYAIQMNDNETRGIWSTTSGGTIRGVEVEWADNTNADRTLRVYGSNSNASTTSGMTQIGTLRYGETSLMIDAQQHSYTQVHVNASGAVYLLSISFIWEPLPDAELESITLGGTLTNTTYLSTDTAWNAEGLTLTLNYSDGNTATLTSGLNLTWNPASPSEATTGDTTVTVSATYEGLTSNELILNVHITAGPAYILDVVDESTSLEANTSSGSFATDGGVDWYYYTTGGTYFNSQGGETGRGLQFGTGKAPCSEVVLYSDIFAGSTAETLINRVIVTAATASDGNNVVTLTVKVNGQEVGSTLLTSSNATYTFDLDTPMYGSVELVYDNPVKSAVYFRGIDIFADMHETMTAEVVAAVNGLLDFRTCEITPTHEGFGTWLDANRTTIEDNRQVLANLVAHDYESMDITYTGNKTSIVNVLAKYDACVARYETATGALAPTIFGNEDTTIAVVVVIITLSAITALVGFYYYDKRRRVNK